MGLDGVELVMEVEEAFGITIPDAEGQQVITVGDLHALVLRKLDERDDASGRGSACASAAAFYTLRRGAAAALGVDRSALRPAAPCGVLAGPYRGRRARWSRLEATAGLRLPPLRRPARMDTAIVVLTLASGAIVGGWAYRDGWNPGDAVVLGLLGLFAAAMALMRATRPFARHLPASCGTVRGLVEDVTARNLGRLAATTGRRPTDAEVFDALRRLVVEQLAVKPEDVRPETRFVADLGMD